MSTETLVPSFMDEVKNTVSGTCGVVDATYTKNGINYLDVKVDERMYYMTPASNWEVTLKYIE
jgi:hypothetical protein